MPGTAQVAGRPHLGFISIVGRSGDDTRRAAHVRVTGRRRTKVSWAASARRRRGLRPIYGEKQHYMVRINRLVQGIELTPTVEAYPQGCSVSAAR